MAKKEYEENDVGAGREFVQAMLRFVLFSHELYSYVKEGGDHGEGTAKGEHQH
jgi:hypothetical protein